MAWGGLHFFLHANKKSAREGPGRALSGGEALPMTAYAQQQSGLSPSLP